MQTFHEFLLESINAEKKYHRKVIGKANKQYYTNVKTWYHGTAAENVASIMKDGLDPSKTAYEDDEKANFPWRKYHKFVFLTHDPKEAASFSPGGDSWDKQDKRDSVILAITLPSDIQKKLVYDRGEFVRCPVIIPPQYIKVYKHTPRS